MMGSRKDALDHFRQMVGELATYAKSKGRKIVLEPQCRINTDFLMTMAETVEFIQSMEKDGIDNLVLEADMFHQALEEKSIVGAMITARPYLAHVQLGDSNRLAPGQGFLPWRDIIETLQPHPTSIKAATRARSPPPNADQFDPSHLATRFAGTPPAAVKSPPA